MPENELIPLILLFLFGGFAVLTALLKTRARVTALLAVALAILEGLSGLALMAAALPTSGSLEMASRVAIVTAVLVALSSTVHMLKVRGRSQARELSEGGRLYAAVKTGIHTSGLADGEDPVPAPAVDPGAGSGEASAQAPGQDSAPAPGPDSGPAIGEDVRDPVD